MEKSYELAAKYNNRQAAETPSPVRKAEDKKGHTGETGSQ